MIVRYRCRFFGQAGLSDFPHPFRESGSAGRVSGHRLADRTSDPGFDSAGPVGFDWSSCFLSWEHGTIAPALGRSQQRKNAIRFCATV
jgi:hypothetical protein